MAEQLPEGVERIGTVLTEVIARRGLARLRQQELWEKSWRQVAGPHIAEQTRVGSFRRGVLEILVGNSSLLQELAAFRKDALLAELKRCLNAHTIRQLRFRLDSFADK